MVAAGQVIIAAATEPKGTAYVHAVYVDFSSRCISTWCTPRKVSTEGCPKTYFFPHRDSRAGPFDNENFFPHRDSRAGPFDNENFFSPQGLEPWSFG